MSLRVGFAGQQLVEPRSRRKGEGKASTRKAALRRPSGRYSQRSASGVPAGYLQPDKTRSATKSMMISEYIATATITALKLSL